jgi:hypothetical protein
MVRWWVLVHCGRLVWTFEHTSPASIFGANFCQNAKKHIWAATPTYPLFLWYLQSRHFNKSQYEMLILSI